MSGVLPSGWALTDIGSLGRYINGRGFGKREWRTSGLPIIRIQNLNDHDAAFNYSDKQHEERYRVKDGDLLVAWAASLGVYVWRRGPAWLNQHIFRVEVEDRVVTKPFLYYALKHALDGLYKKTHGSGMVHVTKDRFGTHPIKLPPRNEQERIVSKVEQLLVRVDEGERALELVGKLVERYRRSLLRAAVVGELTRTWREQRKGKLESAEALLQRILKARRAAWEKSELARMKGNGVKPANDKWKERYREPPAPDSSKLLHLPDGWTWAAAGQLCFVDTGATPKRGTAKYYDKGTIPWITSGAVNETVISNAADFVTPAAIKETNAKVFPSGSLIVALYGEGKTRGKISELGIDAATNQACAALLCGHLDGRVKTYIRSFFEKNYEALRAEAAGGVQPNLNLSILKEIPVPLPPIAEIEVINQQLLEKRNQLANIVSEFSVWQDQSAALRQTILRSAFRGELVPQDSKDEPAVKLLERIVAKGDRVTRKMVRRKPAS